MGSLSTNIALNVLNVRYVIVAYLLYCMPRLLCCLYVLAASPRTLFDVSSCYYCVFVVLYVYDVLLLFVSGPATGFDLGGTTCLTY